MTRGTLAWAAVAWLPFLTALLIFEGPALRRNLRARLPTLRFPNVPLRAFRFRVTIRWTTST